MKYILVNDLKLIKQKKKMVLAYLIILLGYLLYNRLIDNKLNIDLDLWNVWFRLQLYVTFS